METYRRGNWFVSTPVFVQPGDEEENLEAKMAFMVCPHPEYEEENQETKYFEEEEREYLMIVESCVLCGGRRMRLFPTDLPPEPFDPSIPTNAPWWERLYDFGNFKILVRRMQSAPGVAPNFLTRVETASGKVHAGFVQLEVMIYAPAGIEQCEDFQRVLNLGPERYVNFRSFREGRSSPEEKENLKLHVETLWPVASEIGAEAVASAKAVLEQEVEVELLEMEEYEAQAMAEKAEQLKRIAAIKRAKKGKK